MVRDFTSFVKCTCGNINPRIIMIGQSKTWNTSRQIIFITLFSSKCITLLHLLPALASCANMQETKLFSWAKPTCFDFFVIRQECANVTWWAQLGMLILYALHSFYLASECVIHLFIFCWSYCHDCLVYLHLGLLGSHGNSNTKLKQKSWYQKFVKIDKKKKVFMETYTRKKWLQLYQECYNHN